MKLLKDQLNQSKYYQTKANESSQQITYLEEEIARLKSTILDKNSDCNQKSQEIGDLMRRIASLEEQLSSLRISYDRKVKDLEDTVYRLEGENKDAIKVRDSNNSEKAGIISSLEAQIRELQRSRDIDKAAFETKLR